MTAIEILNAFRNTPDKVKEWREIVEKPIFKEVTAVMAAAGPQNHVSTDDSDSKRLGRILGHAEYANYLLVLATRPKDFQPVPETYKEEN